MKYRFEIKGTAAAGQTWETQGEVETARAGEFPAVPDLAMAKAFGILTNGNAVYGKPGKGCNGPYDIRWMLIEKLPE